MPAYARGPKRYRFSANETNSLVTDSVGVGFSVRWRIPISRRFWHCFAQAGRGFATRRSGCLSWSSRPNRLLLWRSGFRREGVSCRGIRGGSERQNQKEKYRIPFFVTCLECMRFKGAGKERYSEECMVGHVVVVSEPKVRIRTTRPCTWIWMTAWDTLLRLCMTPVQPSWAHCPPQNPTCRYASA